jgi:hypothetical protein
LCNGYFGDSFQANYGAEPVQVAFAMRSEKEPVVARLVKTIKRPPSLRLVTLWLIPDMALILDHERNL